MRVRSAFPLRRAAFPSTARLHAVGDKSASPHPLPQIPLRHVVPQRCSTASASASLPASSSRSTAAPSAGASSSRSLPVPRFAPGDYVEDKDLERIAAQLPQPSFDPADFVDDRDLATVERLVKEKTQRAAEKQEEWRREAEAQEAIFVDLDTDEEA